MFHNQKAAHVRRDRSIRQRHCDRYVAGQIRLSTRRERHEWRVYVRLGEDVS